MAAQAEPGEDLVTDRAGGFCYFVNAQFTTDQGGKIAASDCAVGKIGNIEHEEIHRDPAHYRTSLAGYDCRATGALVAAAAGAQEPVRIAQRRHCNARITPCPPCGAVTDCLFARDSADLHDAT